MSTTTPDKETPPKASEVTAKQIESSAVKISERMERQKLLRESRDVAPGIRSVALRARKGSVILCPGAGRIRQQLETVLKAYGKQDSVKIEDGSNLKKPVLVSP